MAGKKPLRRIALGLAVLAALAAIGLGMREGSGRGRGEGRSPPAVTVTQVGGETRLLVSADALAAGGIAVAPVKTILFQERARALATVIAPQLLAEKRRAYQTAAAEAARGELAIRAARLEAQRLQRLHRDDRIVSDKALETGQVAAATEEANFRLAASQLSLQAASLAQQWGPVLGADIRKGSARLDALLAGEQVLVQVSLPAGRTIPTPASVALEVSPQRTLTAAVVSDVPHADPKFQAQGFYALAPAEAALLPGMTLSASVPVGPPVRGVEVPEAAVVRWGGKAYVFVASDGAFVRRPVATEIATPEGWLVATGLPDGAEIVTRGAQLLLSEEMKTRTGGNAEP